jgi:hypothetical protein
MEFLKEAGGIFGRAQEKDCTLYLERDFGEEEVVIIRISIINVYPYIF